MRAPRKDFYAFVYTVGHGLLDKFVAGFRPVSRSTKPQLGPDGKLEAERDCDAVVEICTVKTDEAVGFRVFQILL